MAAGDEVLLTEATRKQAGALDGITVRERGRRLLRSVAEPVVIYEAERDGERSQAGLPIDPVCRMVVDPEGAAGTLRHRGVEYDFCALALRAEVCRAPRAIHGVTAPAQP
jgi:YHS domain-containing protein